LYLINWSFAYKSWQKLGFLINTLSASCCINLKINCVYDQCYHLNRHMKMSMLSRTKLRNVSKSNYKLKSRDISSLTDAASEVSLKRLSWFSNCGRVCSWIKII
jgi:hypothetical protein